MLFSLSLKILHCLYNLYGKYALHLFKILYFQGGDWVPKKVVSVTYFEALLTSETSFMVSLRPSKGIDLWQLPQTRGKQIQALGFILSSILLLTWHCQQNLALSIMSTSSTSSGLYLCLHLQFPLVLWGNHSSPVTTKLSGSLPHPIQGLLL